MAPVMRYRDGVRILQPLALATALALTPIAGAAEAPVCGFEVIASHPHDPTSFTQGLFFLDGYLYEGTGQHGKSSLRRIELESGEAEQEHRLAEDHFGEGVAVHGDRILQLTWLSGIGFVYNRSTFELLGTFTYEHEGWGVTSDGGRLYVSDGSSVLRVWDPESFKTVQQLQVSDQQGPVEGLNELEFVRGELLANVYPSDRIARIDPKSGEVIAWIDLSGLLDPRPEDAGILNGIAFDEAGGRLLVTGKNWPLLFHIEVKGCGARSFPGGP